LQRQKVLIVSLMTCDDVVLPNGQCSMHGTHCPRIITFSSHVYGVPQEEEKSRIEELRGYVITENTDSELDDITSIAKTVCKAPIAFITFVYDTYVLLKSCVDSTDGAAPMVSRVSRENSFCSSTILKNDFTVVQNATQERFYSCLPNVTGGPQFRFYAGCPLISPNGKRIGSICVLDFKPNSIDEFQKRSLLALGRQVVNILELRLQNAELTKSKAELQQKLDILNEVKNDRARILGMVGHDIRQPLCSIQVSSELLAESSFSSPCPVNSNPSAPSSFAESLLASSSHAINQSSIFSSSLFNSSASQLSTTFAKSTSFNSLGDPEEERIARCKEYIEDIKSSAEIMSFLMDNLLHLSKSEISEKSVDFNFRTIDPIPVLNRTVLANKKLADRKNINLSISVDPTSTKHILISMDIFRVEQVLNNLISNGIKYSKRGSYLEVTIKKIKSQEVEEIKTQTPRRFGSDSVINMAEPSNESPATSPMNISLNHTPTAFLLVSIIDNGLGIPSEEFGILFDKTKKKSTRPTESEGGAGLGLSVARQILQGHQGRLFFESQLNVGSTFSFTLPITPGSKTPTSCGTSSPLKMSRERMEEDEEVSAVPAQILNILVADDNAVNQKLIQTILTKRGHTSKVASNGQIAVDMFNEGTFDVIILDHEMPVMNGLEACQIIRSKNKEIPIISMSGDVTDEFKAKCLSYGMTSSIGKPFKVKKLISVVEKSYKDSWHPPKRRRTTHEEDVPST